MFVLHFQLLLLTPHTTNTIHTPRSIFGHPFEQGPRIYLSGIEKTLKSFTPWFLDSSNQMACPLYNETHYNGTEREVHIPSGFRGAGWRHIALSYSQTQFGVYVDGHLDRSCETINGHLIADFFASDLVHVGINDHSDMGNAQPFHGAIDEVRMYSRMLTQTEIREAMYNEDRQLNDLVIRLSFNDKDADGEYVESSGNGNIVTSGGGLVGRTPLQVPSSAPIAGSDLIYWGKERPSTVVVPGTATDITVSLTSSDSMNAEAADLSAFSLELSSIAVASGSGSLIDANGDTVSVTTGAITLPGTSFTFRPNVGFSGDSVMTCEAAITNGTASEPVNVTVSILPNRAPVTGSGGYAISCDGINDFLYSSDFEWPVREFETEDGIIRGGDPITVEFWGWVDASSELDSAVFSVGNQEVASDWVDGFNPHAKVGRLHANVPFSSGELSFHVGTYSVASSGIRPLYEQWNHFALVHDQVSGTTMQVYINGELVANGTHDHIGIGRPSPTSTVETNERVRSLMICSWSFWSEVYHKGFIDELRIWNTSRTQEEVQANMFDTLVGNEEGLYGYWNFDDLSPVADPRAGGDMFKAKDLTSNGNDLEFGGCAPCEDYFKSWMPYNEGNGVYPPDKLVNEDAPGGGYRVCLPSAKSSDAMNFVQSETFGGVHCYGENIQPETRPTRPLSDAPFGGHVFPQVIDFDITTKIILNGTDPDGDAVRFIINSIPDLGTLSYSQDGGATRVNITADNTILPSSVSSVWFTPPRGGGGAPLTSFAYSLTDGYTSSSAFDVDIHVKCLKGSFINEAERQCSECAAGSYTTKTSLATECSLCGMNEYQPDAGQTTCLQCKIGTTFSLAGAAECSPCSTERRAPVSGLTVDETQCETPVAFTPLSDHIIQFSSDPTKRVIVNSVARYGQVYQVEEINGVLRRGASLLDAFSTAYFPSSEFASSVFSYSSQRVGQEAKNILGAPDILDYGESPRAWSPAARSDNVDDQIVVGFDTAVHVHSVTIYETYNTGTIVAIEAYNAAERTWEALWTGERVPSGSVIREFSPSLCPTFFITNRIRISLKTAGVSGSVQIDAVSLTGVSSIAGYQDVYVTDPLHRVMYVASSLEGGQTSYVESFTYTVRDCQGNPETLKSSVSMDVELNPPLSTLNSSFATTMLFFSSFGMLLSIVTCALILLYRNEQVVKASSVPFNVMNCFACLSAFIAATMFNMFHKEPESTDSFCMTFPFLVGFAFSVLFGSFLIKLYRINRIFHSKQFKQKAIPNSTLLGAVGAIYSLDLLINIAWAAINPLQKRLIADGNVQVYECDSDNIDVWYGLHYATKGLVMVMAIVYCVKTRDVPSLFNETKSIGFVSYNAAFGCLLTVGVLSLVQGNVNATVAIVNFGLQLVAYVALIVLFYPKFFAVWFGVEEMTTASKRTKAGSLISTSNRSKVTPFRNSGLAAHPVHRGSASLSSSQVASSSGMAEP